MSEIMDVLALEIGEPPAGLRNLVRNPDGLFGNWSWDDGPAGNLTGDSGGLTYTTTASGTQATYTDYAELVEAGVGDHAGASWRILGALPAGLYYRARLEYRNVPIGAGAGAPTTSAGPQTGYLSAAGTVSLAAEVIPGGGAGEIVYARVRFDFYGTTGGAAPAAGKAMSFDQVSLASDPSAGPVTGLSSLPSFDWTDILGPTATIGVVRGVLDASTLSATIIDSALDPAAVDTLRSGRPARVLALNNDTAALEVLFYGTTETVEAAYEPRNPVGKQVRIDLTAYDPAALAANTPQSKAAVSLPQIGNLIADSGVVIPWNVNGSGQLVGIGAGAGLEETNPGAFLLDAIATIRDTELAYAWITKEGVITAYSDRTADYYGTGPAELDESAYGVNDPGVRFDPNQCVNIIRFEVSYPAGTTTAGGVGGGASGSIASLGPYRDEDSIREWGEHPQTYRIIGPVADPEALAAEIFADNATPQLRVSGLTLPIRSPADITAHKALLDLYALAHVTNTDRGIDQTVRVESIEHTITGHADEWDWLTTLGFSAESRVAGSRTSGPSPAGSVIGVGGVGAPPTFENTDTATATGPGDLPVTLTHTPIEPSLHVYWEPLHIPVENWTLDGNVVLIADPDDLFLAGDQIGVAYAYDEAGGGALPASGTLVGFEAAGWRYKQVTLADATDYSGPGYDDSAWSVDAAMFGNGVGAGVGAATGWTADTSLWLRRTLPSRANMHITVPVEDGCIVYVNGTQIGASGIAGVGSSHMSPPFTVDIPQNLITGATWTLAVRANDEAGGSSDETSVDVQVTFGSP